MPAKKAAKKPVKAGTSKIAATDRKRLFVESYVTNGGNATQAAVSAGLSAKTARQQGARMLSDAAIATEIAERARALANKYELTTERVLQEVARLAFADPRKLFHADGRLKQIHELDDDTAATIASIEVEEINAGDTTIGLTRKVKAWDKNSALEKALKHLGLFEKDNAQRNPIKDMTDEALDKFIARKAKEAGIALH